MYFLINCFLQARELYSSVCVLQPLASQGWLEWAKMEEECGQIKFSLKILREGDRRDAMYCQSELSSGCVVRQMPLVLVFLGHGVASNDDCI